MKTKMILILGGAKSGKSKYAVQIAKNFPKRVAFIATAEGKDEEMRKRIVEHKRERPKDFKTIEAPLDLTTVINRIDKEYKVIVIDCLSLWISNIILEEMEDIDIIKEVKNLIKTIKNKNLVFIVVSNEVGEGIIPENKLARRFRDILGKVNQMMAKESDEVYFLIAGIPIRLK